MNKTRPLHEPDSLDVPTQLAPRGLFDPEPRPGRMTPEEAARVERAVLEAIHREGDAHAKEARLVQIRPREASGSDAELYAKVERESEHALKITLVPTWALSTITMDPAQPGAERIKEAMRLAPWRSNRERPTPCERILAALPMVPTASLAALADIAEALALGLRCVP